MIVEDITALDYLAAEDSARRNGVDKPPFRHMLNELKELRRTQERLAFEILGMVLETLQKGRDPKLLIVHSIRWSGALGGERLDEYVNLLQKVILLSFELMGHVRAGGTRFPPFYVTLVDALGILRKIDRPRFDIVINGLKKSEGETDESPRWKFIAKLAMGSA